MVENLAFFWTYWQCLYKSSFYIFKSLSNSKGVDYVEQLINSLQTSHLRNNFDVKKRVNEI